MAEVVKFKLADLDESLNDPKTDKGRIAAGIREGRRREKDAQAEARAKLEGEHAGAVAGLKQAHVDELNRSGVLVARAAHRDGLWHGIVIGATMIAIVASAALYAGAWLQTSGFTMRVADERIPRPGDGVPELTVPAAPEEWERARREPPDAH